MQIGCIFSTEEQERYVNDDSEITDLICTAAGWHKDVALLCGT